MNAAKEILSSYLDRKIFTDGHNLSDLDILKCMEEYHLAKIGEITEEEVEDIINNTIRTFHYNADEESIKEAAKAILSKLKGE